MKNIIKSMDMKNLLNSNRLRPALYILGAAAILLTVFQAGIFVGYRKAEFSYRWGDNYIRTFGEDKNRYPSLPGMPMNRFPSVNGITGKIITMNLPAIVVAGNDGVERVVMLDGGSSVRRLREEIGQSELKAGDTIVVIGSPDESGRIQAKLVRLIPATEESIKTDTAIRIK